MLWRLSLIILGLLPAAKVPLPGQSAASRFLSPKADYILLIDNSNSIEKPEEKELMRQAVRLFIEVLEEGDKLAIISFSSDAKELLNQEMGPLETRGSFARDVSRQLAFQVNQSNITAAFEEAAKIGPRFWRGRDKFGKTVPKILLLISDGRLYVKDTAKVPGLYRRLQDLTRSVFQDVSIHSLEIKTREASQRIPKLSIIGSDLLQELSARTPNGFHPLKELIDLIENYVAIVKENKGTTTFTSLHTPVEVAEVVKEVRLFILKRDRQLNPIPSEKITLAIDDKPILRYHQRFDRSIFYPLNQELEVRWNKKEGFDFIAIRRRDLDQKWLENNLKAPPSQSSFSIKLFSPEFLTNELVFVVPGESSVHLEPEVPASGSLNHPFKLSLDIWRDDIYKKDSPENKKLEKMDAWVDIGALGQSKNDGKRYELELDPESKSYQIDLAKEAPHLEEGEYWASFFALSNSSSIPPRVDSIPFRVAADYIQPMHAPLTSASDWKEREMKLGVSIDRKSSRFIQYFDPGQPLIEVKAIIEKGNKRVASIAMDKVGENSPEGLSVYQVRWSSRDTGVYQTYYEVRGYRNSEEMKDTVDHSLRFPLVTIYRSPWHAAISWIKRLLLTSLGVLLIRFIALRMRPSFFLNLSPKSTDGVIVAPMRGRRRRRHLFRIKFGKETCRLRFYGDRFKRDAYNVPLFYIQNGAKPLVIKRVAGKIKKLSPYKIFPIEDGDEIVFDNGSKPTNFSVELR